MQQCAQIWRNFVTWQNLENFRVYLVGIWQIIEPNTINVLQSSKLSCCKWPNNIGNWSHCFRVIKNEFCQNKIRTVSCGFNLGNIFSIFVDHEFRQIAYLPLAEPDGVVVKFIDTKNTCKVKQRFVLLVILDIKTRQWLCCWAVDIM